MPFALLLLGMLAFVSAYKDTLGQLGGYLKGDFSGAGNFFYWIAALILVGSIGYFKPLRMTSKMLLLLILVVMMLSDKGFFAQFVAALNAPAPAAAPEAAVGRASTDTSTKSGGFSLGSLISAGVGLASGNPLPAIEAGTTAAGA